MDFYIIGSGGQAGETWWLLKDINNKKYAFKGFIDLHPVKKTLRLGAQNIDIIDEGVFFKKMSPAKMKKAAFAVAIGNPAAIKNAVAKYSGMNFPNLVHPAVKGAFETIELGKGNTIAAGCVLTVNIKINDFNIINSNSVIGHDCVIGNYNVLNPGCIISGGIVIGDGNLLGTNSTVLQNLKIGNNAILGASALLTKNLENSITAIGIPAKGVKKIN